MTSHHQHVVSHRVVQHVYVEHQSNLLEGTVEVRLHVPKLGVTEGLDDSYNWPEAQDRAIRDAIRAAAVALGLMES